MKSRCLPPVGWALLPVLLFIAAARAGDWPMYRADPQRSGYTPDRLPDRLEMCWQYRSEPPQPAWPSSSRITCDFAHQPILVGDTVVLGSTVDDSVAGIDASSGRTRWRFVTGGPVRFAAAGWRDRVFVASDDGCLYALALADGALLWRHRGGPNTRMCLGNGRMISRWPARGGPLVLNDRVYYAAGIWPSSGVYLHALDARTGRVIWTNDDSGQRLMAQPHGGAQARSGVTPQGYLLAAGPRLFVPTGRAVPASFFLAEGKLDYYLLQENGSMGGARALVSDRFLVNGGCLLEQDTGKLAARAGRGVFSTLPDGLLQYTGDALLAYRWEEKETPDRRGGLVRHRGLRKFAHLAMAEPAEKQRLAQQFAESQAALRRLIQTDIVLPQADSGAAGQTSLERALAQARPDVERSGADVEQFLAASYEKTFEVIAAGDEAVCGSRNLVSIVDLAAQQRRWSHEVQGDAIGLAAANGRLLVSTTRGAVYCFSRPGAARGESQRPNNWTGPPSTTQREDAREELAAEEILHKSGARDGYCLDIDCGQGQLALALARRSNLHVIGIESDPEQADLARRRLAEAGVYGSRVEVHTGSLADALFPRYFADLIVSARQLEDASAVPDMQQVRQLQRPYGGVVCLGRRALVAQRRGALEGAGAWTHQNGNAANTLCSEDELLRGPLEVSWFGDGVLEIPDRHAQAPAPLFSQGTLVVEGVHGVCGLDAYNGRTRWVYPMANILADWDGVHHDVGVGDCGGNVCLSDQAVFVRTGPRCLKIDLITGKKLAEFSAPAEADSSNQNWGFIAYAGGLLYGTVLNDEHTVSARYADISLRTESVLLFALDAETGEVKWLYRPQESIRNNAIAIGGGRLYLIDRPLALADRILEPKPDGKQGPLLKPGEHPGGTLLACDAQTGKILWRNEQDIFGTQLAVSVRHGVLLMFYQGVKHGFFKLPSEIGGRMAALDIATGARLWDQGAVYKTRPIINDAVVFAEGGAWDLRSGAAVAWDFQRSYGCGQIASSRHLMLFRSATLGYLDLSRQAGVENFGAIRPSCWFSAIPAGGLALVPDGSSKCACSYQTRAWLALQPAQ